MKALPLPKSFDENEWFFLILLVVCIFLYKIIPKRFPFSIAILLFLFPITTARLTDKFLSAPDIDLYDVYDSEAFELFDLLSYAMYAPFGYFFIYLYDMYRFKGFKLVVYIFGCSGLALGFEWITHQFHLFKYKEFTFPLAFTYYIGSQIATILYYHLISYHRKKAMLND
ncbi:MULTISPECIES: hypothetical protein [unclassified Bacillus (in: firmicutes)]|uniref:hypothetical protein n=1 Tax=unclassified Bacillus (in: firmicutes) TaxID=185979 RepID=UPI0008DF5096|nr:MULTISPECIES: hypothetical protein [unclassified Bacillus (in: firmicutes)]SFB07535.1 hypothetical protein SAMN02799634_105105 [Bacillus sp. UNCCL13]SFQ87308.1 hypothetical protein SAMN04488577_3015 [Bacillus sp. cl95]